MPITAPGAPARALPLIDKDNAAYWTGGADGRLHIYRCQDCRYYIHPPVKFCPQCESRTVEAEPVSGRGSVYSFTINHQPWVPGLPDRFVLALVALAEQDDVLIPTNIVNCPPETVSMGMPVKVLFEQHEEVFVPFFEPEAK